MGNQYLCEYVGAIASICIFFFGNAEITHGEAQARKETAELKKKLHVSERSYREDICTTAILVIYYFISHYCTSYILDLLPYAYLRTTTMNFRYFTYSHTHFCVQLLYIHSILFIYLRTHSCVQPMYMLYTLFTRVPMHVCLQLFIKIYYIYSQLHSLLT